MGGRLYSIFTNGRLGSRVSHGHTLAAWDQTERKYSATIVFESNHLFPRLRIRSEAFNVEKLFNSCSLIGNLLIIRDLDDAKIFSTLIASSIPRLMYSECQTLLNKSLNQQKHLYIRIKSKIKSILQVWLTTFQRNQWILILYTRSRIGKLLRSMCKLKMNLCFASIAGQLCSSCHFSSS